MLPREGGAQTITVVTELPNPGAESRYVGDISSIPARKLAFVIGVQEYADNNIADLKYSRRDAEEVATFLKSKGYEVRSFTDATQPTADVGIIRRGLTWLSRANPNDQVVFYFSGHGSDETNPLGEDRGFLLLTDSEKGELPATALPLAELGRAMDRSAARRFAVLLDTCFAGGGKSVSLFRQGVKSQDFTGELVFEPGKVALYSSRENEPSFEADEYRHGYFTHHLLEAWRSGLRSADQVYEYFF